MADEAARPDYETMDIGERGGDAVLRAFANQAAYCEWNDAPITARVVRAITAVLQSDFDNPLVRRIREWQGAPLADALALRVAGGLHALHLTQADPRLAPIYSGEAADNTASDAALVRAVMQSHAADLMPWLDGPPQTNEAGRSSNYIAAMMWLADRGLPSRFECLEIGSSAGINLMLDRYHYTLGGVQSGPDDAVMHFAPEWTGPPPPAHGISFASIEGCDVAPLDLTDPDDALRLRSYIWPEQTVRYERMDAAIAAAAARAPSVAKMNAADFVVSRLARAQEAGTTRLLMHSIVWQYVPQDQQDRITVAMEAAGRLATADRALAWIRVEANRTVHRHELTVRYWPGGSDETMLARSHAHGAAMEWLGA